MKIEMQGSKQRVPKHRFRQGFWDAASSHLNEMGSRAYRFLNDTARRSLSLEGKVEASLGVLMLLSIISLFIKGPVSGLPHVDRLLEVIVSMLKYFAPFVVVVRILRTIFDWQRPGPGEPPAVIVLQRKDSIGHRFTTKVVKRGDLTQVVDMADRVFGTIRRARRYELFSDWHRANQNTMRLIKRNGFVVGYAVCLPVDPATAMSHLSSDLSQYTIKGAHVRPRSNTIYIQAIFIERKFQKEAGFLIIEVLYGMVRSFIENENQPITVYFEESSRASARWGTMFGFQPCEKKSRDGRRLWALRINSVNDLQFPQSVTVARFKRLHRKQPAQDPEEGGNRAA